MTCVAEVDAKSRNARWAESLEALPGGLAHNINNALTAISGYTGLARAVVADEHHPVESLALTKPVAGKAGAVTETPLTLTRGSEKTWVPLNLASIMENSSPLSRHFLPMSVDVESDRQLDGNVLGQGRPTAVAPSLHESTVPVLLKTVAETLQASAVGEEVVA